MTNVISRDDIERMKSKVQPGQMTMKEARRQQLKKLSDDRLTQWPNTLEATRLKKENRRVEKAAALELERQKIDREEQEYQRKIRLDAIKRANTILLENSGNMKNLRSQQQLSDVVAHREEQIEEKNLIKQWRAKDEEEHHKCTMENMKREEERERKESEAMAKKSKELAKIQKDQLEQSKQAHIERRRLEKQEGIDIIKKADESLQAEAEKLAEKRIRAVLAAEEMKASGQEARRIKLEMKKKDEEADANARIEQQRREEFALARKEKEKQVFIEKQATRQKMIDRACAELAKIPQVEQKRYDKQVAEKLAKQDEEERLKDEWRRRQIEAIDRSRQIQLRQKAQRKEHEKMTSEALAKFQAEQVRQMEDEEALEEIRHRQKRIEVSNSRIAHMEEKKLWRERERQQRNANEKATLQAMAEDDKIYQNVARAVIEEAQRDGKNITPLIKAMNIKDITLLPASTASRI